MAPKFGVRTDEYIPRILHNFLKNITFRGFSEIFKCGEFLYPIQLGRLKNHQKLFFKQDKEFVI